jgi:hypothetical protein
MRDRAAIETETFLGLLEVAAHDVSEIVNLDREFPVE